MAQVLLFSVGRKCDERMIDADRSIGSPNGVGIGYLLAQHKPELGNRRVRKIEAFLADTAASNMREPSIAWEVEDAPAEEV